MFKNKSNYEFYIFEEFDRILVSEEWFVNMRFTRRDMKMIEYLRDYEVVELKAMSEYLEVSVKTLKNQLGVVRDTERIRSGCPVCFK